MFGEGEAAFGGCGWGLKRTFTDLHGRARAYICGCGLYGRAEVFIE